MTTSSNTTAHKNFRAIAETIAAVDDQITKADLYMDIVRYCRKSNPLFDEDKFYDACDMDSVYLISGITIESPIKEE